MNARAQGVAVVAVKAGPCLAMRAERAAAALDVGLTTFLTWVKDGKMPRPVKIGGIALYDFEAVRNAWEALKSASGEDEPNPFDE